MNLLWMGVLMDSSYYHVLTVGALEKAIQETYRVQSQRAYVQAYSAYANSFDEVRRVRTGGAERTATALGRDDVAAEGDHKVPHRKN